ncbi:MAG TPA: outer membrane beta-barrel protein [Opitutaceae bacterium]|nr:outer membrane beta-barrel protein [Opitutaceae bacterium]
MRTYTLSALLCWVAVEAMVGGVVAAPTGPTAQSTPAPQRASSAERRSVTSSAPQSMTGTSIFNVFSPTAPEAAGKVVRFFNPSLQYTLSYGDNLAAYNGSDANSAVHQLSPSLYVQAAERVVIRYSPTFIWYSSKELQDRTDHSLSASAGAGVGNTDLNVGASYSRTSLPLVETGRQTLQDSWSVNGGANVALGERTNLDLSAGFGGRNTDEFTDMKSVNAFAWLRRRVGSTLTLSGGLGASKDDVDPGADISSRQAKVGAIWDPGPKLTLSLELGVNSSSFEGSEDDHGTPVYSGDVSYKLTELTTFSLGARRGVTSSYYANQMSDNESYTLGLSQRLLGHFNFSAGLSWNKSRYIVRDVQAGVREREDEYQSASLALSTMLMQRFSVSLSWNRARNLSNTVGFSRTSTLWGLSIGWKY